MDGTDIVTILRDVPHPYAISMFEGQMYWTEWNVLRLETANLFSGAERTEAAKTIHIPYDIRVVHKSLQPGKYAKIIMIHT